jgi:magnesium transporter
VIRSFTWRNGESLPSDETSELVAEPPSDGWVWVDLAGESAEIVERTCRQFAIPPQLIQEALAEASLPMLEERRDLIYVVLNTFHLGPGGRIAPNEVDIFIGPDFVLSIHDGEAASSAIIMERLDQGIGLSAPSPSGLLAHLAMMGSRRYPVLIDQLEVELDSLEELAMRADPRALNEVYALRRDVIVLRRVLLPQRQIYDELVEDGHPLVDAASRRELERVVDYQAQVLESLEAARSLLGSVLETYRGAVADQTNEIVRVLTVFSAILLPLTLISGIFGMNFFQIPLADEPWGFWITVGAMALIALSLWFYFGRRRFVGTPRLSDLPRAVGLGIYHVGTAPIRVVADGIGTTIRYVTGAPTDEPGPDQT